MSCVLCRTYLIIIESVDSICWDSAHVIYANTNKLDDVLATDLKDFQITTSDAQKEQLKSTVQLKYIEALSTLLENRFPEFVELSAFSIFDPCKLPSIPKEIPVSCHENLERLIAAYGAGPNADVDCGECESEWESFMLLIQK